MVLPADVAKKMATRENTTLIEFGDAGHAPALMDNEQIEALSNWLAVTSG